MQFSWNSGSASGKETKYTVSTLQNMKNGLSTEEVISSFPVKTCWILLKQVVIYAQQFGTDPTWDPHLLWQLFHQDKSNNTNKKFLSKNYWYHHEKKIPKKFLKLQIEENCHGHLDTSKFNTSTKKNSKYVILFCNEDLIKSNVMNLNDQDPTYLQNKVQFDLRFYVFLSAWQWEHLQVQTV